TAGSFNLNANVNGTSLPGVGTINNAATGTFIASGSSLGTIVASNFGGTDTGTNATFNNAGTFRKSGSVVNDTTVVSVIFNNSGLLDVQTGILNLNNTSSHTGTVSVSSGANLQLSGGTHTLDVSGGTTTIAGTLQLATGVLNIATPQTISGTGAFSLTNGSIQGANLTLNSAVNITFGDMRGASTTILNGATSVRGTGLELDAGGILQNNATLTWTAGSFNLNANVNGTSLPGVGTINNAATGTFIASGNSLGTIVASNFGGTDTGTNATFNNAGTFRKSGSVVNDTTVVSVIF